MKTLDQHNEDFLKAWQYIQNQMHKAGVACPKCNNEMVFDNSNMILTSYPPKRSVFCPNCHHTDYIYA
jgi:ribosomal protein S27E